VGNFLEIMILPDRFAAIKLVSAGFLRCAYSKLTGTFSKLGSVLRCSSVETCMSKPKFKKIILEGYEVVKSLVGI